MLHTRQAAMHPSSCLATLAMHLRSAVSGLARQLAQRSPVPRLLPKAHMDDGKTPFLSCAPTIHSQDAEESGRNWILEPGAAFPLVPPALLLPKRPTPENAGAICLDTSPHSEVKPDKLLTGLQTR